MASLDDIVARIKGVFKATPIVVTDNNYSALQIDAAANLKVVLASALSGEDPANDVLKVESQYTYLYISTGTTTPVKAGPGFLRRIIIGGGTAGTIILYNHATGVGPIILSFDSTNALAQYDFDCMFSAGLTIITSAATKLTVIFR